MTEPITDEQIRALRTEAGAAGDEEMVILCTDALDGDEAARTICEITIAAARAQQD